MSWWDFLHPDERDGLVEGVELMTQVSSWEGAQARFLDRDGFTATPAGRSSPTRLTRSSIASVGIRATTGSARGTPGTYREFLDMLEVADRDRFAQGMQASMATGDPISETVRVTRLAGPARLRS